MIYSYEPIDSNFKQLERNKRLNGKIQMKCFQKAVYGHSGYSAKQNHTTHANLNHTTNIQQKPS
ncbi:MAG: hypothetical protein U9N37_00225, partial [Thermodesulfobacteriota bacterium]|nr:hypothetical protein [Thermodesulfobacteriota bacterium]